MDIDQRELPDSQNGEEVQIPPKESDTVYDSRQTVYDGRQGGASPETANIEELKSRAGVSSQNFERAKKAEEKVKELQKLLEEKKSFETDNSDDYSDEGKALKEEINQLKGKLYSFEESLSLEKVGNIYPAIRDKREEFDEFRTEYPNIDIDKVAKIFIAEKGYVDQLKPRIGLEKPTGGQKGNMKSGISNDDVKRLRETNPRRYEQMLRSGKLNPQDIL